MMWNGVLCKLNEPFADGTYIVNFDWPEDLSTVLVVDERGDVIGVVTGIEREHDTLLIEMSLDISDGKQFVRPRLSNVEFSKDSVRNAITGGLLTSVRVSYRDFSLQDCFVTPSQARLVVPPTIDEIHDSEDKMAEALMRAMRQPVAGKEWRDADAYQQQCKTTAKVDSTKLWYFGLGLAGEAGEVADKIKKLYRDHDGVVTDSYRDEIVKELGDTAWYLSMIAESLGVDLSSVFAANVAKLKDRYERGKLHGSGDNR